MIAHTDTSLKSVEVCLPLFLKRLLTYKTVESVIPGQIVSVSIKDKTYLGIVWQVSPFAPHPFEVKDILHVHDVILPLNSLEFAKWVAHYTVTPLGMIAKMMLPVKEIIPFNFISPHFVFQKIMLSDPQIKAFKEIQANIKEKPVVLDGITGSGKTEVYLALCQEALKSQKQVLILLPEIALTAQIIERITQYTGIKPFVWHSHITPKAKSTTFMHIVSGTPGIYIGARSALFLPYKNLGLIIVDEEHDQSYKQSEKVFYHARDMAVVKAKFEKASIMLCSATPSIETIVNIQNGRYHQVQLHSRYGESRLPTIEVIDMKNTKTFISDRLKSALQNRLDRHEQSLIFMNRRGYAPILLCKSCGYKKSCPFCTTHLVFHKAQNKSLCHYCGFSEDYNQPKCKECKNDLEPFGPGIERIHDEIERLFPYAKILTVASDSITTTKKLDELRNKILNNEVDIIISTQILAKGHHFPNITLVGIIDADMGLHGVDIRSTENTYQMLYQVSGRCGRAEKKGHVLIQTFNPEHPAIAALATYDRFAFEDYEIEDRKVSIMPPFAQLATLTLSGKHFQGVKDLIFKLYEQRPIIEGIEIFKPTPTPIRRIKMMFRYRILVRTTLKGFALQDYIETWLQRVKIPPAMKLMIDINPWDFM